jgi:hypothetical protein
MTFDGKAFGMEIVAVVKGFVADELQPIVKRLDDLEQQLKSLPTPKDGKDADPETVAEIVKAHVQSDLADIRATIEAWSAPEPDREVMRSMVETAVSDAISAIPLPKDGKDGRDGIDGKDGLPGVRGEKGECGVGVAGAFIERDGSLAVTLSNGEVKNLGPICGKDGSPGHDGKDGIGFDDLDLVEDASGLSLKFIKGETVKSFPLPVVIDRGVFRDGQVYQKGSGVTWGGRYWIAQETTSDKPDGGKSWRLAVNKGRDGKDAKKAGE